MYEGRLPSRSKTCVSCVSLMTAASLLSQLGSVDGGHAPKGLSTISSLLPKLVVISLSSSWPTSIQSFLSARSIPTSSHVSRKDVYRLLSSPGSCRPPGNAMWFDQRSDARVARLMYRISGVPSRTQGCLKNSRRRVCVGEGGREVEVEAVGDVACMEEDECAREGEGAETRDSEGDGPLLDEGRMRRTAHQWTIQISTAAIMMRSACSH